MSYGNQKNYPVGATIAAPGKKAGVTLLIPADAPMGRAMRRYLERIDRRERRRSEGSGK